MIQRILDGLALRLGYVPAALYVPRWTVPPPRPPMKPDGKTSEQVFEALDDWWSKSKRVEIMDTDTTGPDDRYLMVTLRFTAPKSGSHGEELVRQRAAKAQRAADDYERHGYVPLAHRDDPDWKPPGSSGMSSAWVDPPLPIDGSPRYVIDDRHPLPNP